jgi:ABC-type uncharacterized transport system substrate-binding protein
MFDSSIPGTPVTEQAILDVMHVPRLKNCYVLGSFARRVTFADQQRRALNLIWAATSSGRLKRDDRLAIIGGGLAGVTAAVAARAVGVKHVILIEKYTQLLPLPRGNKTRYIHPNIYDWPQPGWFKEQTELPFLNWKAGDGDDVVRQIDSDWRKLATGVRVLTGYEVTELREDAGKVWVKAKGKDEYEQSFEFVVVAAGFGLERGLEGVPFVSYWKTENLHQLFLEQPSKVLKVLVSGCGDGGLVDAFRLTIENFRHATLLEDLRAFGASELDSVATTVCGIETEAMRQPLQNVEKFIQEQYASLRIPNHLVREIRKRVRKDTHVTLNNRGTSPYDPSASALNRFILALLLRANKLHYQPSEAHIVPEGTVYRATFAAGGPPREFDHVVIRHGPTGQVLDWCLLPEEKARLKTRQGVFPDVTREPHWPEGFFQIKPALVTTRRSKSKATRLRTVRVAGLLNGSGTYTYEALNAFRQEADQLLLKSGYKLVLHHELGVPEEGADKQNAVALATVMKRFGNEPVDFVLTIGSGITGFYSRQPDRRPHIYTSVTDAFAVGVVGLGEEKKREREVCGSSFLDARGERLRLILNLFPHKKKDEVRVGFIWNPNYTVDTRYIARLQSDADALGGRLRLIPIQIGSPETAEGCDADVDICLGWLFVNLHIGPLLKVLSKPLLGSAYDDVRNNAVAAIGPDDEEMGVLAADILHQAVVGKVLLGDISLPNPKRLVLSVNLSAAQRKGLVIPAAVRRRADIVIE